MPFMIGSAPIRRTLKYLESGKIIFRESVKIFSVNCCYAEEHHKGAREFVFWHLCQIQYKNPKVQCQTFRNLAPTPFIKIYFEDAKSVLIDLDSRERDEILNHLVNLTAVCKTQKELHNEAVTEMKASPAHFGFGCERHCICEVMGQVPCPCVIKLPDVWRMKNRHVSFIKKFRIPPCYMKKGLDPISEDE